MYTCPMHPEIHQQNPGQCPKCSMNLVLKDAKPITPKRTWKDFTPLIVIFTVIFVLTIFMILRQGNFELVYVMSTFEGFFFLIFGIFKLLNWRGFADAYSTYDLIAKRNRVYAYAYPLIELVLGAGYLFSYQILVVTWITLILMLIGATGVFKEIRKKNQIMCACLGVVFKIPMTWVTFIEDLIMAVMAFAMILMLS